MSNLDLIRGRQVVVPLTNRAGSTVSEGDVVILSGANDESFDDTTTGQYAASYIGIVQEEIDSLGVGRVLISGYAPLVNVGSAVARLDFIETDTAARQATGNATRRSGSFGQFIKSGTSPSALIWGMPDT